MYYNHNLRTNLQEWKNRLYKASYTQFGHQLKHLLKSIEKNKMLFGFMSEACIKYKYDINTFIKMEEQMQYGGAEILFDNDIQRASFNYQFIKYSIENGGGYNLHNSYIFQSGDMNQTKNSIVEDYISPILYFLHDSLDKSSSIIYLLEKYKRRTEWFTRDIIINKYKEATKNYEQIFEDDLRLFLFDQGIDYPFSTPKSTSGRADIIGSIDTDDPLIVEIKIFDREKGYGKNRIREGFTQAIKYTNDYNKDIGYLVVFNTDKAEIDFKFSEDNKAFPPKLSFNNKTYFFIVINLFYQESASKIGTSEIISLTEEDLVK